MLDKVVNASILRAISERINDEDCVTEETRLDFSAKSGGGGRFNFPVCHLKLNVSLYL